MPSLHDQLEVARAQRIDMERKREATELQVAILEAELERQAEQLDVLDAQLDTLLDQLNDQQHRRAR